MSKSIYDKALEIIDNNTFKLDKTSVLIPLDRETVVKALEQAQKQEKDLKWQNENADDLCIKYINTNELLKLYKQLNIIYEKLYTMELSELSLNSNYYEIEIIKLKQQIKKLENAK